MWTPPLVTLVICCGSILVFLAIIFVFVFVETRRASGKVAPHKQCSCGTTCRPPE